ncbi:MULTISPECIES: hypothetical protein [Actinosynnema]|uniref:hypothetical protein n=1 Tax=Actinosynnema TaxID=40566 RepID=UPI0020A288D0|nr:hypothetical protein [Actinosynnema pretiosum]
MRKVVNEDFDASRSSEVSAMWKDLGSAFQDIADDFKVLVTGSEQGWTGEAGNAARNALGKVGEFSKEAGEQFTATSKALDSQVGSASHAKNDMPEPSPYEPEKMLKQAAGTGNVFTVALTLAALPAAKEKSEEAKQKAVQVMRERDNSLEAAAKAIPAFSLIPSVTEDQGVSSTPDIATHQRTTSSNHNVGGHTGNDQSYSGYTPNGTPVSAGYTPSGNGGGTTQASWAASPGGTPVSPAPTLPQGAGGGAFSGGGAGNGAPIGGFPGLGVGGSGGGSTGRGAGGSGVVRPGAVPGSGGGGRGSFGGANAANGANGVGGARGLGAGGFGRGGAGGGAAGGVGVGGFGGAGGRGFGGAGGVSGGGFGAGGGFGSGGASGTGAGGSTGALGNGSASGVGAAGRGAAGAGGSAGARGTASAAGAGGMGAGGRGGSGDGEDLEHKSKYLVPTDDYFDDGRMVAPPTIGG